MARVLVIADDLWLGVDLRLALIEAGHEADLEGGARDAIEAAHQGGYDAAVIESEIPPDVQRRLPRGLPVVTARQPVDLSAIVHAVGELV